MGSKKKAFPYRSGPYGVGTPHSQPAMSDEIPDEPLMQRPTRSNCGGRDWAGSSGLNTRRASWSLSEDMCFLAIFRDIMVANNNDNDNITRDQWEILVSRHNERTPGEKVDKHQIQCRLKTLKKLYSLNRALRSKRGWTWDDSKQMAVAPDDETWEELIEYNNQYRKVRCKPFPQYNTVDQMFGKSIPYDLGEGDTTSASLKEEIYGVEKINSVQYVRPLSQMPMQFVRSHKQSPVRGPPPFVQSHEQSPTRGLPPFVQSHEQSPTRGLPQFVQSHEQSPVRGNVAYMNHASHDPTPCSSSDRKRPRNMFVPVEERQNGYQFEETSHVTHYIHHRDGWKADLREVHKKIKSVPGATVAQRIAAMEACRDPMTRQMLKIFDPDELQYWLEKLHAEPREGQRYPEAFEVHERAVVSPVSPVPDPPSCVIDLAKTCTRFM